MLAQEDEFFHGRFLVGPNRELRITERCLTEDLRRGPDAHLEDYDHGLMGYDELWGIQVVADEDVPVKRCRIKCHGSAETIDEELAEYFRDPGS